VTVLIAIKTTEVGVAVFSVTRNNKVRHANEQISMPEPLIELKIPPRKPVATSTAAFQLKQTNDPQPVEES
jgi:hypothetical protein